MSAPAILAPGKLRGAIFNQVGCVLPNHWSWVGREDLRGHALCGVMIDLVSMSSASLGKGHFFTLVQADLISIFFPVSSVHGKKKAQRSESWGEEPEPRSRAVLTQLDVSGITPL